MHLIHHCVALYQQLVSFSSSLLLHSTTFALSVHLSLSLLESCLSLFHSLSCSPLVFTTPVVCPLLSCLRCFSLLFLCVGVPVIFLWCCVSRLFRFCPVYAVVVYIPVFMHCFCFCSASFHLSFAFSSLFFLILLLHFSWFLGWSSSLWSFRQTRFYVVMFFRFRFVTRSVLLFHSIFTLLF